MNTPGPADLEGIDMTESTNPFFTDQQLDDFRRRVGALGTEMQRATQALAKAFRPVIQAQIGALKPLIEWANSPEGKAAITAYYAEHGIYPRAREVQECHCFCAHNHPGESACLGEIAADKARTVRYGSDLTGPVDVPMCPPCAHVALRG